MFQNYPLRISKPKYGGAQKHKSSKKSVFADGVFDECEKAVYKIKSKPQESKNENVAVPISDLGADVSKTKPKPKHTKQIKDMEYQLLRGDLTQRNKIRDYKKKEGLCYIRRDEYIPIQNKFTEALMTVQKRGVSKLPERINEITKNTLIGMKNKNPNQSSSVIDGEWFLSYQTFKVCPEIVKEYIKAIQFVLDGKNKLSATLQKRLNVSKLKQLLEQFINISKPKPKNKHTKQIKEIEKMIQRNKDLDEIDKQLDEYVVKDLPKPKPIKLSGLDKPIVSENETLYNYHKSNALVVLIVEKDKLWLEEFVAQYNRNEKRAKKGVAYNMLCKLVTKLVENKHIDINKNLALDAISLKSYENNKEKRTNQKRLVEYYKSKGF